MIVITCEDCGNKIGITDGSIFQAHGVACPACGEMHYVATRPASRAIAVGAGSRVTVHGDVAGGSIVRGGGRKT